MSNNLAIRQFNNKMIFTQMRLMFLLIAAVFFGFFLFLSPAKAFAATKCWVGPAGGSWSTASNWATTAGGATTVPGSSDTATFDPSKSVCTGGTPANTNSTVDASFAGTVGGVSVKSGYTATITQSINLIISGTAGYVQAGGTWDASGGSSAFTINTSGAAPFTLSGGTFKASSGTLTYSPTVSSTWNTTGGTFTAGSGTVDFESNQGQTYTITNSTTFNNLSFIADNSNGYTASISSGTTLTVSGTLTLNGDTIAQGTLNGPGGITAQGNISVLRNGWIGSAVITVSGTGAQTLSGDGVNGNTNALPAVTINKSSGTLTIQNTISPNGSWTYTAGSLTVTGSTVNFESGSGNTINLSGTMTFNNLTFTGDLNSSFTGAIASGTILTVSGTLTFTGASGATVNGPGTITAQGNITTSSTGGNGNVAVTLSGSGNQTVTDSASNFPTGTVTFNKTAGTVTLAHNWSLNSASQGVLIASGSSQTITGAFTITINNLLTVSGTLTQGTATFSAGGYLISSGGVWSNTSTGGVTIGSSGMSNSGTLTLDGTASGCGDSAGISVTSSSNGTQRSWTGSGAFTLYDIKLKDQTTSLGLIAYNSTNTGNNSGFTFTAGCPPQTSAAYWKFDEGTGTVAHDSGLTSSPANGTLSGTTLPVWESEDLCISGKCLYFDGVSSDVSVSTSVANVQTVAVWVRPDSVASAALIDLDGGTHKITISSGTLTATGFASPTYYVNGISGNQTLTANTWSYVVITTATPFTTGALTIGKSSSTYFQGFMDEIKLYSSARTAAQIKSDYAGRGATIGSSTQISGQINNAYSALSNGLVGYWKMDESSWIGSTGEVKDSSGNGNNGTIQGGTAYSPPASTTITTLTTSQSITRSSHAVSRVPSSVNANQTASIVLPTASSGSVSHYWQSNTPYTSWTDQGSFTNSTFSQTDDSVSVDVDGIQASGHSATGNTGFYFSTNNGGDPYHFSNTYTSGSYGTAASDTNIGTTGFGGATDSVILPNSHLWVAGTNLTAGNQVYSNTNANAVLVGLALTPVGTAVTTNSNDGIGRDVTGALTASSNPIVAHIGYRGSSTYTVYVVYNDGAGNLKFLSFADGTVLPNSTPTSSAVSTGASVKDSQFSLTTDTFGDMHLVAANSNGIQYWYMPFGNTAWNGPYSVSSSSNDDQPTVAALGSSQVVVIYRHYTGTTNKYNITGVVSNIVQSGTPSFGQTLDVFTDSAAVNAGYPSTERISADGSKLLVAYTTGTTSPWTVKEALYSPILSIGGTTQGAGKFGSSASFNGTSGDDISVASSNSLASINTMAFWINPTTITQPVLQLASGVDIKVTAGTVVTDGMTSPTIYVNGAAATTISANAWSHVVVTTSSAINANALLLGSTSAGTLNGQIDDVRLYNRALSASDVFALYNFAPGPVAYWNFQEGTGLTVNDISGNAHTATWNGTGSSHWMPGKYGSAGNFNGTDDYVSVNNSILGIETVSFWVNPSSTTAKFLDLDGGTHYISASSGTLTATGFASPTIYVNGVVNGTITANTWNYVAVTTATSITGSAVTLGKANGSFLTGKLDETRFYNYPRTQKQVIEDMNASHPTGGSPVGTQIGYWKFDEGYGTTAHNSGSAGSVNDATLKNMASPATSTSGWQVAGKFGKALAFDGINDYVSAGNDTSLQITSNLTLSSWVKLTDHSSVHDIITKKGVSGQFGYRLFTDTSGKLNMEVSSNGTALTTVTGAGVLANSTWYHVAGVYNPSTSLTIYVNGVQDGQNTTSIPASVHNSTSNLEIGSENGGASNLMNGTIDEAKIYPSSLTQSEVKIDMNRGSSEIMGALSDATSGNQVNSAASRYCIPGDTSTCSSPYAEFLFEDGNGTTTHDTSGNEFDGTWHGTGIQHWVPGKIGTAGNFNGTDDYVEAAYNLADSGPAFGQITVEAWIKPSSVAAGTQQIISNASDGSSQNYTFEVNRTAGKLSSVWGNTVIVTGNTSLSAGVWYHVALVRSGSSGNWTASLYVNGALDKSVSTATNPNMSFAGGKTDVGALLSSSGVYTQFFNGNIDQIETYRYPRSAAQIAWDYNRGGPEAWWKFDECKGGTVNDSSGNSNSGTINLGTGGTQTTAIGTGSCSTNASTPWYNGRNGKFNSSLNFDGTDDYISVGTSISGIQAITFWVYPTSTNQYFLDLDGGTHYISASSGTLTATGFASPTIYVNGVVNGTITANTWNYVAVTTATSITGSAVTLGKAASTHFLSGQLDDVQLFDYVLTSVQIQNLYNQGSAIRFGPSTGLP